MGFRRLVAGGPVPALESVQLVELVLQLLVECERLFEHVGSHKGERQRFLMTTGEISTSQAMTMKRVCHGEGANLGSEEVAIVPAGDGATLVELVHFGLVKADLFAEAVAHANPQLSGELVQSFLVSSLRVRELHLHASLEP